MKIEYTELEHEKALRIEAQLTLLQEQGNRLLAERKALYDSILDRGEVPQEDRERAVFSMVAIEIPETQGGAG